MTSIVMVGPSVFRTAFGSPSLVAEYSIVHTWYLFNDQSNLTVDNTGIDSRLSKSDK